MSRIDADNVQAVIENDSTIDMEPFIEAATALTDWVDSCDTDSVLSNALLFQIETYLAAHFYGCKDQPYESRKTGDAQGKFQGEQGMYLDQTDAGRRAMLLDVSGCLSKLNRELKDGGKRKVGLYWLGTELTNTGTAARNLTST
ncbi:hypothetical protein OAG36_00555 [bacterium]|nr:hypothetical protein [bacterium]